MNEMSLGDIHQNQIVWLMINDAAFVSACVKKGLRPIHFTGRFRAKVVQIIYDYHQRFGGAPGFHTLEDLLVTEIVKGVGVHEEDIDTFSAMLSEFSDMKEPSDADVGYLTGRLNDFIKQIMLTSTFETVEKMLPRLHSSVDKCWDIIKEAVAALGDLEQGPRIESLRVADIRRQTDIVAKLNIPIIDYALGGGLRIGNFVVLLGYTNVGKSWFIDHVAKMAARLGESSFIVANEMANWLLKLRLRMCFTGLTKDEILSRRAETDEIIDQSLLRSSEILLVSDEEKSSRVDELPTLLKSAEERYGQSPRLILLDSADDFLPPPGNYRGEIEKNTAIYVWLKNWAKDENLCVVTTTQAQRRGETKWWCSGSTVGDNIKKIQKATVGLSINATPLEIEAGFGRFYLFKHTDGPVGAKVWFKKGFEIGQMFLRQERYNHREYIEMLRELGVWKDTQRGDVDQDK